MQMLRAAIKTESINSPFLFVFSFPYGKQMAATRGMTINSYSMEPKWNRNILSRFFCQEKHVRMQFETTYCKQMHFAQVSEPFVSTAMETWV